MYMAVHFGYIKVGWSTRYQIYPSIHTRHASEFFGVPYLKPSAVYGFK